MKLTRKLKQLYRLLRDVNEYDSAQIQSMQYGFELRSYRNFDFSKFEMDEANLILHHLKSTDLFIDIGANIGFYTCLACANDKDVISFEPSHNNSRFFLDNIKRNNFQKKVTFFEMGLSDSAEVVRLYGGKTAASLLPNWSNADEEYYTDIYVNSIDNILSTDFINRQILVKIDVEGFEYNVLSGAKSILELNNPKPKFLVEITYSEHRGGEFNSKFLDTFELFWANGYTCTEGLIDGRIITKSDVVSFLNNGNPLLSPNGNYFFY